MRISRYCFLNNPDVPFVEFLRGAAKDDECAPLFQEYKKCLSVSRHDSHAKLPGRHIVLMSSKAALKERGVDKMLEEARADSGEMDAENMRPQK